MCRSRKTPEILCPWLFRGIEQMEWMPREWNQRLPGYVAVHGMSIWGWEGKKRGWAQVSLHLLLNILSLIIMFASNSSEILTVSSAPMTALLSTLPESSCCIFLVIDTFSVKICSIWVYWIYSKVMLNSARERKSCLHFGTFGSQTFRGLFQSNISFRSIAES